MTIFNLAWSRWKKIPGWFAEPRNFWLFVGGVVVASLLGDWFGCYWDAATTRQDRVRYSGWILDTLGLVAIAMGISSKLDQFQDKNLLQFALEHLENWLRRFPLLMQHRTVAAGTINLKMGAPTGSGFGKVKINPDKPTEEKVDWLLERYYDLVDVVQGVQRDLRDKEGELSRRINDIESAMKEKLDKLEEKAADAHVGDVGTEFVGLFWIFAGISFATVPEFIELWFAWPIHWFEAIGSSVASALQ